MSTVTQMTNLSGYASFASSDPEKPLSYRFRVQCPMENDLCGNDENYYDPSAGDQGFCGNRSDAEGTSNRTCMDRSEGCCGDNSRFLPTDYGEPIKAQKVAIDFTPVEGVDDNQSLMQKCTDFWKLLEKYPDLEKLKVIPETSYSSGADSGTVQADSKDSRVYSLPNKTASFWVEKDWIMNSALTTDMRKSHCKSFSYSSTEPQRKETRSVLGKSSKACTRRGAKCLSKHKSTWDSEQLGKEMDAWDQAHVTPKSLGA